jgi:hypothetical protein
VSWGVTDQIYIDDVEVNNYPIEPGAHLSRASFERANLSGTYPRGAHLLRVWLSNVNLRGANRSRTALIWADLSGAFADQTTRWPEGFDPAAAGVNGRVFLQAAT